MKRVLSLLFLAILIPFFNSYKTPGEGNKKYVDGQVMVKLRSIDTWRQAQVLQRLFTDFKSIDLKLEQKLSDRLDIFLLNFNDSRVNPEKFLEQIKAHPDVQFAQFNHYIEMRAMIPNDIDFALQWNMHNTGQSSGVPDADIDAPEAWDLGTSTVTATGDTIIIAISDDGFDLDHPDLRFWKNYQEIPGNGTDDDGNGYIDDYDGWNAWNNSGQLVEKDHGTHVTGIAAARGNNGLGVTGVNQNIKVMPVMGNATVESIVVGGYAYILEMRALYNETNGQKGAFVVSTNASFGVNNGFPDDYPIWGAMYDSLGMVGVLSAGATANGNYDVDVEGDIPTAFTSNYLITVTNTDDEDVKSSFAAYGAVSIDLGAPGTQIYSTRMGNAYGYKTGTSMASPHVAGAVAYMYSIADEAFMNAYHYDPAGMALVIKEYILDGTDPLPSLAGITVTGGRLNINKAASRMLNPDIIFNPISVRKYLGPDQQDSIDLVFTNNTGAPFSYTFSYPQPLSWSGISGQVMGTLNPSVPATVKIHFNTIGMTYDTLFSYLDFNYGNDQKFQVPVHLVIPEVSVNITASLEAACPGEIVELTSDVTGGAGNYIYSWTSVPAGTSSSDTNITVSPEETTTYYLQVSDESGNTGSDFIQVFVKPMPGKPLISSGPGSVDNFTPVVSTYTCSATVNTDTYIWYVTPTEAGSTQSSGTSAEFNWTPGFTGPVQVMVVGLGECGIGDFSDSFATNIYSSAGIDDPEQSMLIELYPNPASTMLRFQVSGLSAGMDYSIGIIDISGIMIEEDIELRSDSEIGLNVSDYPQGIYSVILRADQKVIASRKFIVKQ
jgi:hypothetical protein